jgi:hypothetical protein
MAEQFAVNEKVLGSNPSRGASSYNIKIRLICPSFSHFDTPTGQLSRVARTDFAYR